MATNKTDTNPITSPMMKCILLIDGDNNILGIFKKYFKDTEILYAKNSLEGLAKAFRFNPPQIFINSRLPDHSGYSILSDLKRVVPTAKITILSNDSSDKFFGSMLADEWIHKENPAELKAHLKQIDPSIVVSDPRIVA